MKKPRVVILGSGYAGILTTVRLQRLLHRHEAEIVLVNKHNYHYMTTWLHETAAGTGDDNIITIDIDSVFDTNRVRFIKDTVVDIQKDAQLVILENGDPLAYDYLVVGLGYEPATYGIPGIAEYSHTIRSINSAREIRTIIENRFAEYAMRKDHPERLIFVVGGAGFTGIEFVGELAERIPQLCTRFGIHPDQVRLLNVEGAPSILAGFDESIATYTQSSLEQMGVEFRLSTKIKSVGPEHVTLLSERGEETLAAMVIWTGGIQGNTVVCDTVFEADRGRIPADEFLRIPGYTNAFVIGDCSSFLNKKTGRPYPPTAQIAILQSKTCADNVAALVQGKRTLKPFDPFMKGAVTSIGKHDAAGVVFGIKLKGKLAVFMKALIDVRYLWMLGGLKLVFTKGKIAEFLASSKSTMEPHVSSNKK
ncbi:FAD-dependent oxidoreductase [Heliobacillus mobilis]|uniref:FAD-dependent oxidoreductase n=1 Tax=Heliobacterium mobile TaxID=28064 RepID=A0A6I3SN94_HELMO|nr:NAD(P)/FAD-dependent oxidoreductase [Heliobacterium mobile]MTV50448.1 FAD-dependent oxidoreductase [Heliobacterium mobile]